MAESGLKATIEVEGAQKAANDLAGVSAEMEYVSQSARKTSSSLDSASKSASSATSTIDRARAAFEGYSRTISTAHIDKIRNTFLETGVAVNTASREVEKLAARIQTVARNNAFKTLAQEANLSSIQIAKLRASVGDYFGAISSLYQGAMQAKLAIAAVGVSVVAFGKFCLDAQIEMQRLEVAYEAVFGGQAQARLQAVYEQANKVGLNFQEAAQAAKGFFAAGQGTSLEGDLQKIFNSITNAGAALQLSTDEMNGALVALGQMISKGKVQAEELRGQLGERLPGAFSMAAKAMGMTTAELDKFMADGKLTAEDLLPKLAEALEERYGEAAKKAADTVQGSINQMETEWFRFKASIIDSGPVVFAVKFISEGLKDINDAYAKTDALRKNTALLEKHGVAKDEEISYLKVGDKTVLGGKQYSEGLLAMADAVRNGAQILKSSTEKADKDIDLAVEKAVSDRRKVIDTIYKGDSTYKNTSKIEAMQSNINKLEADNQRLKEKGLAISKAELDQIDENNKAIASAQKQIGEFEKKIEKAGKTGSSAASKAAAAAKRAAVSQADYTGEVEQTQARIASLQEQLGLDKTEKLTAEKIKIEEKYQTTISKTNEQIAKRVAQGSLTAEQGEYLKKQNDIAASYEKQLALQQLEEKQTQKNVQLAQGQLKFYKELAKLSGGYSNDLDLQKTLIHAQAEEYKKTLDISEDLVAEWERLMLLQQSSDPIDGAYRGILKYKSELADTASQWEDLSYNLAKNFTSTTRSIFDDFIDTGKASLDGFKNLFKQFLKDLVWQAAMQPIMLSIVGGVGGVLGAGSAYGATGSGDIAAIGGSAGSASGGASLMQAGGQIAQQGLMNQLMGNGSGGLLSGITSSINSTVSGMFPSMFAASGQTATINTAINAYTAGMNSAGMGVPASSLPTTTFTSALGSAGIGGMIGSIASPFVNNLLGLQNNTGSSVGSMIGGGLGTLGGALLATSISTGPVGWIAGGIAALGSLLGGGIGSLFGGGQKQEPKLEMDLNAALWNPLGEVIDTSTGSGASLKSGSGGGYWLGVETTRGASGQVGLASQFGDIAQQIHEQSWNIANALGEVDESLKSQYLANLESRGVINQHAIHRGEYINEEQIQNTLDAFINNSMSAMLDSLNSMDLTPLVMTADGKVASTAEELAVSFGKIFDFLNTSAVIEDEERRAKFVQQGINQMNHALENVSLKQFAQTADGLALDSVTELSTAFEKAFSVYDLSASLADESAQKAFQEWAQKAIVNAFAGQDLSFLRVDFDQDSFAGLQQAYAAIQAWNTVQQNIESVIGPSKELSSALSTAATEFDSWTANLRALGWQEEAVAEVESKRGDYLKKILYSTSEAFRDFFEPVSEFESAMASASDSFDDLVATMRDLGATEEQIAAVEARRTEYLWEYSRAMTKAMEQDLHLRTLALGYGSNSMTYSLQALKYQQQNEREEAKKQYGEGSAVYQNLVGVQNAEYLQALIEQLKGKREELLQGQIEEAADLAAAHQQELTAIGQAITAKEREISEAERLADKFRKLAKSLNDTRWELWTGEDNLKGTRFQEAYRQFDELYEKALTGDEDALNELDGKARDLLALGREQLESRGEYNDAFYDVDQKLKKAQLYAEQEVEKAESQIDLLQKQLDALNGQKTELEGVIEAINAQSESMQAQLDALNQQSSLLAEGNMSLDELNVAIALLEATLKSYLEEALESDSGQNAQQKLLQEHASYINSINYGGRNDWTAEDVYKAIIGSGNTVESWYEKYGKYENGGSYAPYDADAARQAIVANKVAALNATAHGGKTDWTAQDFYNAIGGNTAENIDEWYRKWGIDEGISNIYQATQADTEKTIAAFIENLGLLSGQTESNTKNINKNLGWTATDINKQSQTNTGILDRDLSSLQSLNSGYWPQVVSGLGDMGVSISGMSGSIVSAVSGLGGSFNSTLSSILAALSKMGSASSGSGSSSSGSASSSSTSTGSGSTGTGTSSGSSGSGTTSGIYGSKYASETALINAKVAALNRDNFGDKNTWTYSEVKEAINNAGGTKTWYEKWGKAEGFAKGGITPANRPFWVGEEGPELMMAPRQYGVLSNEESEALFNQSLPAIPMQPGNSQDAAELRELLAQAALMISYLRQIVVNTNNGAYEAGKCRRRLDEFANEGLPVTQGGAV